MPLDILKNLDEVQQKFSNELLGNQRESITSTANTPINGMAELNPSKVDLSKTVKNFSAYNSVVKQAINATKDLSTGFTTLLNSKNPVGGATAGLQENVTMWEKARRNAERYNATLMKTSSIRLATSTQGAVKLPRYAVGGLVRGTSKTGDRNVIRVNAGEWVLTERQMDNLARLTGSASRQEVFRKAGGNNSKPRKDSQGISMFASGGVNFGDNAGWNATAIKNILRDMRSEMSGRRENAKTQDDWDAVGKVESSVNEMVGLLDGLNETQLQAMQKEHKITDRIVKVLEDLKNGTITVKEFDKVINKAIKPSIEWQKKLVDINKYARGSDERRIASFINKNLKQSAKLGQSNKAREDYKQLIELNTKLLDLLSHKTELKLDDQKLLEDYTNNIAVRQMLHTKPQTPEYTKLLDDFHSVFNEVAPRLETTRKEKLAEDTKVQGDYSKLSAIQRKYAEDLEKAGRLAQSSYATESEKDEARQYVEMYKKIIESLMQTSSMTSTQKSEQVQKLSEFEKAGSIDEKKQIVNTLDTGELGLDNVEREIGGMDSALIKFNEHSDAMVEEWKSFLGGTPLGLAAVGVALVMVGKKMADFANSIADSVENIARLKIETGYLKTNLDSTFGAGTFEDFRKSMNLTYREMSELGPMIQETYRNAGIGMNNISAVASNIKDAFGALDPKKLQEALGVLSELTTSQQNTLLSGGGSRADMTDIYANLMASGKSGQAADLIEQGIFGKKDELAGLSDGDKAIVKSLQDMKIFQERTAIGIESYAKGALPKLLKLGKGVAILAPVVGGAIASIVTARAVKKLVTGQDSSQRNLKGLIRTIGGSPIEVHNNQGSFINPNTNPNQNPNPNNPNPGNNWWRKTQKLLTDWKNKGLKQGGSLTKLFSGKFGGLGGIGGKVGAGLGTGIAGAVGVGAVAAPLAVWSYYANKKAEQSRIKREEKSTRDFIETGYYTEGGNLYGQDKDKVKASTASGAFKGALAGGTIGGTIGMLGGPVGALIGGEGGAALGALIGGTASYFSNNSDQADLIENNPLLNSRGPGKARGAIGATGNFLGQLAMTVGKGGYGFVTGGGFEALNSEIEKMSYNIESQEHVQNTNLINQAKKTQEMVDEIRKIRKQNVKRLVTSLRLQEGVESISKKIASGAFARFEQMNIEGAQASNQLITQMGGSNETYGSNITRVLESATGVYTKTIEQINIERQKILNAEQVDSAARINSMNTLVKQQAEVTKKWLDEILASIGKYNEIPTVIQNSLKDRISQISLEGATKGFGASSSMASNVAQEMIKRQSENITSTVNQFLKENQTTAEQIETANKMTSEAISAFQESQSKNNIDWLPSNITDENGKINQEAFKQAQVAVQAKQNELDQTEADRMGYKDLASYQNVKTYFESVKNDQAKFQEFLNGLDENMSKDEFKGKQEELKNDAVAQIDTMITRLQEGLKIENLDATSRKNLETSLKGFNTLKDSFNDQKNFEKLSKGIKQFKGAFSTATMAEATASANFDRDRERALSPKLKKLDEQVGRGQASLQALSSAHDAQTAALKAEETMITGFAEAMDKIREAGENAIKIAENNPLTAFYNTAQEFIEESKDMMMEIGQYGEYASASINNLVSASVETRSQLKTQIETLKGQLEESQTAINNTLTSLKTANPKNENIQKGADLAQSLATARQAYIENQTTENEKQATNANKALNDFLKSADNGLDDKTKDSILSMANASSAMLTTLINTEKELNKHNGDSFRLFQQMVSNLENFRGTQEYMVAQAKSSASETSLTLARMNLNTRDVKKIADVAMQATKSEYDQAIQGLEQGLKANLSAIDKQLATETNSDKRNALTQQKEFMQIEVRQKKQAEEVKYKEQVAKFAQAEVEAKKRMLELQMEAVDIQGDLLSTIGAPMGLIVKNERQRVALVREEADLAKEQYNRLKESGASQEEIEKSRNEWMRKEAESIKAQYGAQRSMMEKIFGNMIGSFSSVAGIMAPGNLANKYGYGYYENKDGLVIRGGEPTGGYRERIEQLNMDLPKHAGEIPDTIDIGAPASGSVFTENKTEPPKTDKAGTAGNSTTADMDWGRLGESFKDQTQALEAVVLWEKKIYEAITKTVAPALPGPTDAQAAVAMDVQKKQQQALVPPKALTITPTSPQPLVTTEVAPLTKGAPALNTLPQPLVPAGVVPLEPSIQGTPTSESAKPSVLDKLESFGKNWLEKTKGIREFMFKPWTKSETKSGSNEITTKAEVTVNMHVDNKAFEDQIIKVVTKPSNARKVSETGMDAS